ncbi:MAG: NAD(P)H-binding protein, partial [Bacteroidales bacterium]
MARNPTKLKLKNSEKVEVIKAEITKPNSIKNCCDDIDIIISTVGITKQKDGLTYMDVDYQANGYFGLIVPAISVKMCQSE